MVSHVLAYIPLTLEFVPNIGSAKFVIGLPDKSRKSSSLLWKQGTVFADNCQKMLALFMTRSGRKSLNNYGTSCTCKFFRSSWRRQRRHRLILTSAISNSNKIVLISYIFIKAMFVTKTKTTTALKTAVTIVLSFQILTKPILMVSWNTLLSTAMHASDRFSPPGNGIGDICQNLRDFCPPNGKVTKTDFNKFQIININTVDKVEINWTVNNEVCIYNYI